MFTVLFEECYVYHNDNAASRCKRISENIFLNKKQNVTKCNTVFQRRVPLLPAPGPSLQAVDILHSVRPKRNLLTATGAAIM